MGLRADPEADHGQNGEARGEEGARFRHRLKSELKRRFLGATERLQGVSRGKLAGGCGCRERVLAGIEGCRVHQRNIDRQGRLQGPHGTCEYRAAHLSKYD